MAKKVEMIAMKDLLGVTGYIRGGVRGLQLEIAPADLIGVVGGIVADVAG